MIYFIIFGIVCIMVAAISDSIVDICNHHFEKSVFNDVKYNREWWDSAISWKNKYTDYDKFGTAFPKLLYKLKIGKKIYPIKMPVQITDAFHYFKMCRIIFDYLGCILLGVPCGVLYYLHDISILYVIITLVYTGILRNVTFSLFYNHVFRNKVTK